MTERRENAAQDAVIKVLVLGDTATGKTSFIKRYVHDMFTEHHRTTIGVDFALKAVTVSGTTVRLQLWDIAGQEHFRALNRVYYKDALGALLVYDMSRPETFDSILKWKKEIDAKVELPNGKPLPVILCGNKCDLKEEVDREFLDEFCATNNFTGWFDTSAKENVHIDEAAKALVVGVLEHPDIFERKSEAKKHHEAFRPTSAANRGNTDRSGWCCNSF
ncbi:unnamed protein product [Hyaloperonospora brassicae]|uniref:Ras-related protein Rab n=1 Tax=Hyaloperonospora brassicae TaxID=162125 RepID=A0AAV0UTL9_HYABA|nr:unnamed protein product [Hyaloperonospora brassicae]